ncbi:MAG: hypothetical protein Q9174_006381 [Haloplaca sp. 1 TL-2023]
MAALNIADTSAKTFAELMSGPIMDVYVGQNRRHWCLHRDLLCYHSPFFHKKCPGKDKHYDDSVELLDEDPKAFELLVKWLYQGKIEDVSDMPIDKKWDYADACQKLYIMCGKINMPQLKNLAIDQFRKGCYEAGLVPGPEEIKPIYDTTPQRSPIRKLISQIAARQIMDPESQSDAGTYRMCFESSADFAIDVVNAIRQGTGTKLFHDPTEEVGCFYHEHGTGQMCKVG